MNKRGWKKEVGGQVCQVHHLVHIGADLQNRGQWGREKGGRYEVGGRVHKVHHLVHIGADLQSRENRREKRQAGEREREGES